MMRRGWISRLFADRKGVSAVEFALIAPFLIVLYLGSVQVTLGLSADRKLTAAASTIADLVAQNDELGGVGLADIFAAGDAVMQPYPLTGLALRVTSLRADAAGNASIVWSQGRGMARRTPGDLPSVPAGLLLPDGGLIVVEATYAYNSPLAHAGLGQFNLTETVYMRPRRVSFVAGNEEFEDDDAANSNNDGNVNGNAGGNGNGNACGRSQRQCRR